MLVHVSSDWWATRSKVGRKVTVGGIRSFKPEKASCAAQGLAWLAG